MILVLMIVWCMCLCVVIIVVDVFNKVTKTNSYVVFYVNKVVVNALQTTIVNNNIKHFCFIKHPNIQYYTNKTTAKCLHRHKLQHVCKVAHRTAPAGLNWSYILKTNDIRVITFKHHIANTKVRHKPYNISQSSSHARPPFHLQVQTRRYTTKSFTNLIDFTKSVMSICQRADSVV